MTCEMVYSLHLLKSIDYRLYVATKVLLQLKSDFSAIVFSVVSVHVINCSLFCMVQCFKFDYCYLLDSEKLFEKECRFLLLCKMRLYKHQPHLHRSRIVRFSMEKRKSQCVDFADLMNMATRN